MDTGKGMASAADEYEGMGKKKKKKKEQSQLKRVFSCPAYAIRSMKTWRGEAVLWEVQWIVREEWREQREQQLRRGESKRKYLAVKAKTYD